MSDDRLTQEIRDEFAFDEMISPGSQSDIEKRAIFDTWLAERDRQVAERAWDEGEKAGLLRADFEYGAIGYRHVRGNPHRAAKGDAS